MEHFFHEPNNGSRLTFRVMSVPAKALATCIIFTIALGMLGALGQIVIHDIIPTFSTKSEAGDMASMPDTHGEQTPAHSDMGSSSDRGDLFSELTVAKTPPKAKPFYKTEQFVWILKWTHIHLFGINMIFIFMGVMSLLLDTGSKLRIWLIVLPFVGILVDISAMWLKGFVSPVFFWLHIPGGGIFGLTFGYVTIRALWEMWIKPVKVR